MSDRLRKELAALTSAVEAHLLGMRRLSDATWSADTTSEKALLLLFDLELALNQARIALGLTKRASLFREERGEGDGSESDGGGRDGRGRLRF